MEIYQEKSKEDPKRWKKTQNPSERQFQKVLEDARRHHTATGGERLLGGAGWPPLAASVATLVLQRL